MTISLNDRALQRVLAILARPEELRVGIHTVDGGGRYVDLGIGARGGWLAGIELARVCLGISRTSRSCRATSAAALSHWFRL